MRTGGFWVSSNGPRLCSWFAIRTVPCPALTTVELSVPRGWPWVRIPPDDQFPLGYPTPNHARKPIERRSQRLQVLTTWTVGIRAPSLLGRDLLTTLVLWQRRHRVRDHDGLGVEPSISDMAWGTQPVRCERRAGRRWLVPS